MCLEAWWLSGISTAIVIKFAIPVKVRKGFTGWGSFRAGRFGRLVKWAKGQWFWRAAEEKNPHFARANFPPMAPGFQPGHGGFGRMTRGASNPPEEIVSQTATPFQHNTALLQRHRKKCLHCIVEPTTFGSQ